MADRYEIIHGGAPSRKPQLGPSPIEQDEVFLKLVRNDPARRPAENISLATPVTEPRPYVSQVKYEHSQSDRF